MLRWSQANMCRSPSRSISRCWSAPRKRCRCSCACALHSTGKTLAERPQDAAKFLAGEMLGLRYAATHKDEAMKVAQKVANIKPDDPRPSYIYDLACKQHAIGTDVPIPMDKFNWLNRGTRQGRQHSETSGSRRRCSTARRAKPRSRSSHRCIEERVIARSVRRSNPGTSTLRGRILDCFAEPVHRTRDSRRSVVSQTSK